MNSTIIHVSNLTKSYGKYSSLRQVLKGISFDIKKGEFVSLMGPSGCGKSTLLYLLAGLTKPIRGTITVCDQYLYNMSDTSLSEFRRQNIGFVFQFYNLVPSLTVEDNIMIPIIMDGKKIKDYKDKLISIVEKVGISDKLKSYPHELSGGEQQRVAIARALIINPKIIFADEPTGNLDKRNGEEIMQLFKQINKDMNVTILQVTHSQEMANYSDRIIKLLDGEIVEDSKNESKQNKKKAFK